MATVKKIATELNWDLEKSATRGKVKGYSVSVLQNTNLMARQPSYKTMVVTFDEIDKAQAESLVTYVQENKKQLKVMNYKVSGTFISIYINEGLKGLNAENLTKALDLLVEGFMKLGINPPSKCVYCNEETTDEVISNRISIRAHQACFNQAEQQIAEVKKEVKYGTGILGAVLGAFVGSLVFFVVYIIGWILPLSIIGVGFATFFGYKLLGGVFTDKAKVIIAVVSVVSVLLTVGLVVLLEAVFIGIPVMDMLTDTTLGYGEPFAFAVLWGLISSSSGYGLAKRREF